MNQQLLQLQQQRQRPHLAGPKQFTTLHQPLEEIILTTETTLATNTECSLTTMTPTLMQVNKPPSLRKK